MMIFALFCCIISGLICCGEVYYERDWPRDTIQYFLGFAVLTAIMSGL